MKQKRNFIASFGSSEPKSVWYVPGQSCRWGQNVSA